LAREVAAGGEFFREVISKKSAMPFNAAKFQLARLFTMDEITIPHSRPVCCTRRLHSKGVPL
jgi:hypothetical protein